MENNILEQLGLEESEAKIYTALLELGPATVSEITQKAGVTRTLGYHVLEKLGWYGLVNRASGEGKKMQYVAEHPRSVLQFVKNKKEVWQRRVEKAEAVLPELMTLYKIAEKPVVRYVQGTKGVMNMVEETLGSSTEILSVLDVESWRAPEFLEWARGYNRERNRRKIKERVLILNTPAGREWIRNYHGSATYTIYRWVESEQVKHLLEFGGELNIYENKVMMALLKQPHRMCVTIENGVLANIMMAMFELVWVQAKPALPGVKGR
ncbi:MAG: helix-turn-helix domain-containing protein [Patescibacteria group bacterium]